MDLACENGSPLDVCVFSAKLTASTPSSSVRTSVILRSKDLIKTTTVSNCCLFIVFSTSMGKIEGRTEVAIYSGPKASAMDS